MIPLIRSHGLVLLFISILLCGICSPAAAAELTPVEKAALKAKIAAALEQYDNGDDASRDRARKSFATMRAIDVVTVLLEDACTGGPSPQRDRHLNWLIGSGPQKKYTIEQLYPVLMSDPAKLCWSTAQLLMTAVSDSDRNVEVYERLLEHPDMTVRARAIWHLDLPGEKAAPAAEAIARALADNSDSIRHSAWLAMVHMGRSAVPVLVKTLEHQQASVRFLAADALYHIGPPARDAVPALIRRLNDEDKSVRVKSMAALRRIGEPKDTIIDAIVSVLGDENPGVREAAVNNLRDMGRDAIKTAPRLFILKYSDSDREVRHAAGVALDRVGPTFYLYCALLVLLTGLIWRLFLRANESKPKTLYGVIAACFGHPLYLFLALYLTYNWNLSSVSRDLSLSGTVGYTTILLMLFFLRYGFFLYHAWDRTRSPLEKVHPYAAAAFFRAHRYCILGVPMYVWLLYPLDASGGIVYFPIFLATGIAGIVQSVHSLGQASSPEKWAPPGEIAMVHSKEEAELIPLDPKDERRRRIASMIPACLGVLVIGTVAFHFLTTEWEGKDSEKSYYKRMLAKEQPGTAGYHLVLGKSYAKTSPVNSPDEIKETHSRALAEFNKAIALDPKLAMAYKERGQSYRMLEEYARAVEDFNTFERLSEVVDGHMYFCRAAAYKALGMNDKMCADYWKACSGNYSCHIYEKLVAEGLCKY